MMKATYRDVETLRKVRAERKAERAASDARIAEAHEATRAIVLRGICPDCGEGLRRNNSLPGWWQCEQFGAETFRKNFTKPACNWQGFTEAR